VTGAQMGNAARGQGLQEMATMRQMPVNELMAMLSGTQVNNPQFANMSPTQIAATPWMQAAQNTGAQNQQIAQSQNASQGSLMSGLGALGSAALMSS
jgi:hypothetical protein